MTDSPLSSRLLIGTIAGIVGTAAMTAVMNRLHQRLPPSERYPLPPREITQAVASVRSEPAAKDLAMAAHFVFGGASAAALAAANPRMSIGRGVLGGVAVWAASYLGWVPAARILRPVSDHPIRRTALMVGAHLVWGAVTALTSRELDHSRRTVFNEGPQLDRAIPVRR